MKKMIKTLTYLTLGIFFISCTEYETIHQSPCNGNCGTQYDIIYENQIIFKL